MKKILLGILTIVVFSLLACNKDHSDMPGDGNDPRTFERVRSIEWSDGTKATLEYLTDDLLKSINYSFQNTTGATIVKWNGKQLKEMYDNRSLFKNVFYFTDNRLSHYVNDATPGTYVGNYKIQYEYTAEGKLSKLLYYTTNEQGTSLKSTSVYYYHSNGDLAYVVSTLGNVIITHVIEGYSPVVHFDPLIFMETTLSEHYPIYNYPVLHSWNKLPLKVTRKMKISDAPEFVDKISENNYDIVNKRLNKITTNITVPGFPEYTNNVTANFFY